MGDHGGQHTGNVIGGLRIGDKICLISVDFKLAVVPLIVKTHLQASAEGFELLLTMLVALLKVFFLL